MAIARERESGERVVVVVGLPIVMPTTKQWDKVEVGLGFGNIVFVQIPQPHRKSQSYYC